MTGFARQTWVLLCRNLRVVLCDPAHSIVLAVQAPLIAVLAVSSFWGMGQDDRPANELVRTLYHFHRIKAPLENQGRTVDLAAVAQETREAAQKETFLISEAAARRKAGIYFVLVSASLWIGILGSCREIVSERNVLLRELRACTDPLPYLAAKFLSHALLVAVQTAVLLAITYPPLLGHEGRTMALLWAILLVVGVSASSLGLLVSAVSSNTRVALTIVPILMMPQLLLGGLLRPATAADSDSRGRAFCERLVIQRWGFEAALTTDRYAKGGVLSVVFGSLDTTPRYAELNVVKPVEKDIHSMFFGPDKTTARPSRDPTGIVPSRMMVLAGMTLAFLALTYTAVRIRFR